MSIILKPITLTLCCLFLLTACTTTTLVWHKDGVSQYESDNIKSQCEYDIDLKLVESPNLILLNPQQKAQLLENCMKKQGFRQKLVTL